MIVDSLFKCFVVHYHIDFYNYHCPHKIAKYHKIILNMLNSDLPLNQNMIHSQQTSEKSKLKT